MAVGTLALTIGIPDVFPFEWASGAVAVSLPESRIVTIGRRATFRRFTPNPQPTQTAERLACLPPSAAQANACAMTRVGFFSGSFDPMTNGHLDVIEHAAALCDRLVVGVGSNPNKAALFTVKERLKLIREAAAPIMAKAACELDVVEFTGLAIEAARKAGRHADLPGPARRNRFRL